MSDGTHVVHERAHRGAEEPAARVVVGVDGSAGSRAALRHALTEAGARGATCVVVSSYPEHLYWLGSHASGVEIADDFERETRSRIAEVVSAESRTASGAPPEDRIRLVVTSEAPVQVLLAHALGADLLVVGSRGHGALRSSLLGSVSLHCVTEARCPVVVVHESTGGTTPAGPVVVGWDGSADSEAALAVALREAARRRVALDVVAGYRIDDYWVDLYAVVGPGPERLLADLRGRADEAVDRALSACGTEVPAEVRTIVVEGASGHLLTERSRDAGLLVVGSHGHGARRHLALGSVALHCVVHAGCPVEVVHGPEHRDEPLPVGSVSSSGSSGSSGSS